MKRTTVVIGSRGSALALRQANEIADRLLDQDPELEVSIQPISTTGDRQQGSPLWGIGDKGVFVKEIETALREGAIDLAVHSMKDMPTDLPGDLIIAAVPRREAPNDVLVSSKHPVLAALPAGALIGTSSLRRQAQLLRIRPDLSFVAVRGNIATRLRKLAEDGLAALVLAAAGLERLGITDSNIHPIPVHQCVPAVGQGALCVEARADDRRILDLAAGMNDPAAEAETRAERAFLRALQGGCQIPAGALARLTGDVLTMRAIVLTTDGSRVVEGEITGLAADPETLGDTLARRLLDEGGREILEGIRRGPGTPETPKP